MFISILACILFCSTIYLLVPYVKTKWKIRHYAKAYKNPNTRSEICYVDKMGNNWYHFPNILDMHPKRAMKATVAEKMGHLCITPEMLDRYIREIRIANDKGNTSRVGYLIERMDERRLLAGEKVTLESMMDAYFFIEGEDPESNSEYWTEKKKDIWSKDSDCHAFFLHKSFTMLRSINELSKTDIMDYLLQQELEKNLNRL